MGVFLYTVTVGPHNTVVAVLAKNMPPAYFLNACTVLKEMVLFGTFRLYGAFFYTRLKQMQDKRKNK